MNKKFAAIVIGTALTLGSALPSASALSGDHNQEKVQLVQKQWLKDKGSPSFSTGKQAAGKVKAEKEARSFIQKHFAGKINASAELTLLGQEKDELGFTHYKYIQSVNGVPIDGAIYMVHADKNGNVTASNGALHENAGSEVKSVKAKLSKSKAAALAWKSINLSKKETEGAEPGAPLGSVKASKVKNTNEKGELVLYKKGGTFYLTYKVQLQFIKPYGANWQIYVDANSGAIIDSYNAVNDAATVGSGTGVLGDTKTLNTYFSNNTYYLFDDTKTAVIETYTARNGSSLPGSYSVDSDNRFIASNQRADVDAHFYAGKVFDYYKNTHGRNSYDNAGATIRSTVHYGSRYNNAFWNGSQMVYGDGDGTTFTSLSGALDVVAHEITHAVIERSANLQYQNQSGALNESMADVFGYFLDPSDYLMGEDVYTPGRTGDALRSISNPEAYGQPSHFRDYYYTSSDNGGVHTNSGIPNKAFYYINQSIGKAASEKIYYRALTRYLTPTSSFSNARASLLQSAADLYGSGSSQYNAVASAWTQVGIN
ncbi:peptidase M4 family protein [Bacillus mangrovi]|uniref:Neutral metalloproteinase n=1 Tax=Metabacillus mangrovi TaxID=1491830 RepID=A0A7X2S691_9BACI|nr:M4 family metallopeptidase [Metabacillus mangrovi]MTH54429.1 peptidase M4 family protein [Metabacillus mangrovi]